MPTRRILSEGWSFTQISPVDQSEVKEYSKCLSMPTSVHVELVKAGKIPHPYKGQAEWDIQWVAQTDWKFKTTFNVLSDQLSEDSVDLVFDGLDTYCDVHVNGTKVISTDNMFRSYRVGCKSNLKQGDNHLELVFKSPVRCSKEEEANNGGVMPVSNGTSERAYARKAQYGWGWDWGPVIQTVGPWRPIALESYTYRFEDIKIDSGLLAPDYNIGTLKGKATINSSSKSASSENRIQLKLCEKLSGKVVKEEILDPGQDEWEWKFGSGQVESWWPVGYGKQPLYELCARLVNKKDECLAEQTSKVAFRHAQLIEEPLKDAPGTSFFFKINGVRVFCGGSNWIPGDNFLTEMGPGRYRQWIELMVQGNQNMLRIWGGGIYEDESLYDACDELGVLVWQDFMFGCAIYPSYDKINANIKAEAGQVVCRLRDHPSVVIFAGNNEDYQMAESLGLMDWNDNSGDYMHSKFPGRHIYEVILPEVVGRLSNIAYHRSSPYGGKDTTDPTVGDIHQWNVWHGSQEPWTNWDKLAGRFVSEFGMQGYPDLRTVREWDDDEKQLFPQSRVSVQHNKATGFERRIELYLMENFRHAFDMPSYVYYTQVMQAECLAAAYRLWRREWKGEGREYTAGALVWQINDCWPCVSWAIVDYYMRPKPAFFAIARELKPYTVAMARKETKSSKANQETGIDELEICEEVQLWGCNSTLKSKNVCVELKAFDLDNGPLAALAFRVKLAPNASTEIWKGEVPSQPTRTSGSQAPIPIVLQARLYDEDGTILSRYSNWPEPFKYITFPDPKLEIASKGDQVTLNCQKPIKGLVLDVDGEECRWSDQAIDLFPGDEQVVNAKGLGGRKVKARYLGDGSA